MTHTTTLGLQKTYTEYKLLHVKTFPTQGPDARLSQSELRTMSEKLSTYIGIDEFRKM